MCAKSISVPAGYTPSVAAGGGVPYSLAPEEPKPVVAPPPPSSQPIPAAAPPPGLNTAAFAPPQSTPVAPAQIGSTNIHWLTISPNVIDWIPLGCLILAFLLTFFTWVGAYPGGEAIFKQSAWSILSADMSVTVPSDDEALLKTAEWLEKNPNGVETDWLLLPYFLLLFIALGFACLERAFKNPNILSLPAPLAWLPSVWPRRFALLTILSALLLVFLCGHVLRNKALPGAMQRYVETNYSEKLKAADTSIKKRAALIQVGQELGKYCLQSTTYRSLAIWVHIAAVVAMAGRWWLHRREGKPPVRIGLQL